jgi:hypothetical protein
LPSWAPPPAARPATAARATPGDADGGPETPATRADTRRAEGIRLGLALAYSRAFSGADDRLSSGSPSLIPLELAVSFRTSPSMLLGFNGYYGIASRDDCIKPDSCRARGYGFGGHIENVLGRGKSFVPFIRYGLGYEVLYHGGAPLDPAGHTYRGAFDFFDFRIGGDFIASQGDKGKTTRIGAYAGFVGGLMVNQTGVSYGQNARRDLDRSVGSAHLWFTVGLRATLDP